MIRQEGAAEFVQKRCVRRGAVTRTGKAAMAIRVESRVGTVEMGREERRVGRVEPFEETHNQGRCMSTTFPLMPGPLLSFPLISIQYERFPRAGERSPTTSIRCISYHPLSWIP